MKRVLAVAALVLACAPAASAATKPYDFNGDGRQELAAGIPSWHKNGKAESGAVLAVRAGRNGLKRSAELLARSTPGFPGDPTYYEFLGVGVASGDFNGDGYADLAIRVGAGYAQHSLIVVYGSAHGLVPSSADDRKTNLLYRDAVAGDVDRDGYADLALRTARGGPAKVIFFRGGPGGLARAPSKALTIAPETMRLSDLDRDGLPELVWANFRRVGVCRGTTTGPGDCTSIPAVQGGDAIAAGNLTGDKTREVVVGTPYRDAPGAAPIYAGAVHVYRWAHGELSYGFSVTQATPGVPGRSQGGDQFGYSVEVGRIGRRKRDTLIVGAPGTRYGSGRVTIIHGAKNGIARHGNWAFDLDSRGVPGDGGNGEELGFSVALLDHNGDGRLELDAGAPKAYGGGHVINLRGSRSGLRRRGVRNFGLRSFGFPADDRLQFGQVLGR